MLWWLHRQYHTVKPPVLPQRCLASKTFQVVTKCRALSERLTTIPSFDNLKPRGKMFSTIYKNNQCKLRQGASTLLKHHVRTKSSKLFGTSPVSSRNALVCEKSKPFSSQLRQTPWKNNLVSPLCQYGQTGNNLSVHFATWWKGRVVSVFVCTCVMVLVWDRRVHVRIIFMHSTCNLVWRLWTTIVKCWKILRKHNANCLEPPIKFCS